MKYGAIFLAVTAVQGYLIPPKTHRIDWRYEQKRQIVSALTSALGKGGKVSDPGGVKRVNLQSDSPIPGTKRVKVRSGPYMVPNINKTSIIGEPGMLWNYPDIDIGKPCSGFGGCVIVGQWAGLEFKDGRNANIDSGLWLHHMVSINSGAGRYDPTCQGRSSLPHVDVQTSPASAERYFSSGNERSQIHLDVLGAGRTKWGYHLGAGDKLGYIVDLMNINTSDQIVYMTMYYDFLEGGLPAGWKNVRVIWLDANQCGTSEYQPPKQTGSFTVSTSRYSSGFEGEIIGMGAHVHDGGVQVDIMAGNQIACSSKAGYGETPEYVQKPGTGHGGSGGHGHGNQHLSSMSQCYLEPVPDTSRGMKAPEGLKVLKLTRGLSWSASGKYDYDKYGGMKNSKGKQDEIMVISLVFIAANS